MIVKQLMTDIPPAPSCPGLFDTLGQFHQNDSLHSFSVPSFRSFKCCSGNTALHLNHQNTVNWAGLRPAPSGQAGKAGLGIACQSRPEG